jgi:ApaG protein
MLVFGTTILCAVKHSSKSGLFMTVVGQTSGSLRNDGLFTWRVSSSDIDVAVVPEFLPSRSSTEQNYYAYAYHVTITNFTRETIQLLRRSWIITDGAGRVEEVEGDGVVGEQPFIKPGESYSYSSGCPLRTATGNMRGWYFFKSESGQSLKARIPLFFLRPNSIRTTLN